MDLNILRVVCNLCQFDLMLFSLSLSSQCKCFPYVSISDKSAPSHSKILFLANHLSFKPCLFEFHPCFVSCTACLSQTSRLQSKFVPLVPGFEPTGHAWPNRLPAYVPTDWVATATRFGWVTWAAFPRYGV